MPTGYSYICYNSRGEILCEEYSEEYPTPYLFPEDTVRIDIALPNYNL